MRIGLPRGWSLQTVRDRLDGSYDISVHRRQPRAGIVTLHLFGGTLKIQVPERPARALITKGRRRSLPAKPRRRTRRS
jgi:hypothetical protein